MSCFEKASKTTIEYLNAAGFEGYVVGGYVRNSLMGLPVSDVDVCTSAKPEETIKVFENFSVFETGIKHGTVTVIIDGTPVEITTFRKDGEYKNHRSPVDVQFTSTLKEDLSRRDFTVNAMAIDSSGNLYDFFGGKEDLEKKLIKCVGNPEARFEEDALRVLRALRFSSVLEFDIEDATKKAIFSKYNLLKYISKERITEETIKLLGGRGAKRVLREFSKVFSFLSGSNIENELDKIEKEKNDALILLSFFENTDFLRLSSADKKAVNFIRKNKEKTFISDYDILNLLKNGGIFATEILLNTSKNFHLLKNFNDLLSKNACYSTRHLAISGDDLKSLGFSGKDIGKILSAILFYVMEGKILNTKDDLTEFIKKNNFFA